MGHIITDLIKTDKDISSIQLLDASIGSADYAKQQKDPKYSKYIQWGFVPPEKDGWQKDGERWRQTMIM